MSGSQLTRIERLEASRTDVTTELVVLRHGEDSALFSRTIRYLDPAEIQLRWPERNEVVDSFEDHNTPEVESDLVQHRYTDAAI